MTAAESSSTYPPSSFFAHITSPCFDEGIFTQYSDAIASQVPMLVAETLVRETLLRQNVSTPRVADSPEDTVVCMPASSSAPYRLFNFSGRLLPNLLRVANRIAGTPSAVPFPDSILRAACSLEYLEFTGGDLVSALNSDGLALNEYGRVDQAALPECMDMQDEFEDDYTDSDIALFRAGMHMVLQKELTYDKAGEPQVSGSPRTHYLFGAQTSRGFVPLVTRLDRRHPVVQRIITEQLGPAA